VFAMYSLQAAIILRWLELKRRARLQVQEHEERDI
jgi:hypothetical protein